VELQYFSYGFSTAVLSAIVREKTDYYVSAENENFAENEF
jgi:hypothetical protein